MIADNDAGQAESGGMLGENGASSRGDHVREIRARVWAGIIRLPDFTRILLCEVLAAPARASGIVGARKAARRL